MERKYKTEKLIGIFGICNLSLKETSAKMQKDAKFTFSEMHLHVHMHVCEQWQSDQAIECIQNDEKIKKN